MSVTIQKIDQRKGEKIVMREMHKNLLEFFNKDIIRVVEYITLENIPVEVMIPSKRVQIDPNREYLMMITRLIKDLEIVGNKLEDKDDEEFNFWGDDD